MPTKTTAKKAPAKKAPAKKATPKKAAAAKKAAAPAVPERPSQRAYTAFEQAFKKRFGEGSFAHGVVRNYKTVSTGSITLDDAMGGGYVVGRLSEIWGPESVGKTTVGYIAIANFQRAFPHKRASLINMERTYDPDWAEANGVDLTRLDVLDPHDSEDVSDMSRMLIESRLYSVVVLDSIGGMITAAEMAKDADEEVMGRPAKIITRMVKQCAVLCDETQTSLILINQVRAILSSQGGDTSAGPKALRHVSTHKLRMKRTTDGEFFVGTGEHRNLVGILISVTVEKNKIAPPRKIATFALFNQPTAEYGPVGIDRAREAFTVGKRRGVIVEQSSGRYLLPGEEASIHGEAKVLIRLRADEEMLEKIRREMLAANPDISDEIEPVEILREAEDGAVLDFSGRITSRDGDGPALDRMRDDARADAIATAQ